MFSRDTPTFPSITRPVSHLFILIPVTDVERSGKLVRRKIFPRLRDPTGNVLHLVSLHGSSDISE